MSQSNMDEFETRREFSKGIQVKKNEPYDDEIPDGVISSSDEEKSADDDTDSLGKVSQ